MSAALDTPPATGTAGGRSRGAGSAYPVPVAELAGRVREQATGLGAWPSLRQVMTTHRVGRPKAAAALDALRANGFTPADPAPVEPAPSVIDQDAPSADARTSGTTVVPDTPDTPGGSTVAAAPSTTAGPAAADVRVPDMPPVADVPQLPDAPAHRSDLPADTSPQITDRVDAGVGAVERWRAWPLLVISLGAFVSIWGGWVGLGEMTGFGPIRLLPGIADQVVINSAITLPLGVEAYAAFALRAWLAPTPGTSARARRFACWSAVGALGLGAAGQVAYHLMAAAEITRAPWPITAFVSCLPVLVLGCGAALTHLTRDQHDQRDDGRRRHAAAAPHHGEV